MFSLILILQCCILDRHLKTVACLRPPAYHIEIIREVLYIFPFQYLTDVPKSGVTLFSSFGHLY